MTSAEIDKLWDWSDASASEARFRALEGGEARTQVARALGLQKRFDEGHAILNDLGTGEGVVAARIELERGRLFRSSGLPDQALAHFQRAVELSRLAEAEFYELDALHMVALVVPADEAIKVTAEAMEIAASATEERARNWEGTLANNLGWTHHDAGRFEEALQCFERQLEVRLRQGEAWRIPIARWCIARCLRSLCRVEEALSIQLELIETGDGYAFEEAGECLWQLDRKAEARPYFSKAAELLKEEINPERLANLVARAESDS
jgi:tetratricopeptide (TPR) repeat protein